MESAADAPATTAPADDAVSAARTAFEQTLRLADAAFKLLRAELRLARSSVLALLALALALVFFGVGAWLATSAALAAGIYLLTGNVFYGIGLVALVNLAGIALVARAMRTCWGDLGLPRTRRALGRIGQSRT